MVKTITDPGSNWQKGKTFELVFDAPEIITYITLGSDIIPDARQRNNEYFVD